MRFRVSIAVLACLASPLDAWAQVGEAALSYVDAERPGGEGLERLPTDEFPWAGGTVVRIEQVLQDLPVLGGELFVSMAPDGQMRWIRGRPAPRPLASLTPKILIDEAIQRAEAEVAVWGEGRLWDSSAELAITADDVGGGRLVWWVRSSASVQPMTWDVVIDAETGATLRVAETLLEAVADVYPTNPLEGGLERVGLERLEASQLEGTFADVVSCVPAAGPYMSRGPCEDNVRFASPDAQGDFLYPPQPMALDDPFVEVNVYHHVDRATAWFVDVLQYNPPTPMRAIVNLQFSNAFYGDVDGDGVPEVAFGQGGGVDFGYDADVIVHELAHALVDTATASSPALFDSLGATNTFSSVDEGSADFFAAAVSNDPEIGRYAAQAFEQSAPRMLGPDKRCPDDLYGEPHVDGLIWSSLAWNLASDPSIGPELAAKLVHGSVLGMPADVAWSEMGARLLETAAILSEVGDVDAAAHQAVKAVVGASGLGECERIIPLETGLRPTLLTRYWGLLDLSVGYYPLVAQFSVEVPPVAKGFSFTVERWKAPKEMAWVLFARRGAPVEFAVQQGQSAPIATDWDLRIEGTGEDTVVFDASEDRSVHETEIWYIAVAARGDGMSILQWAQGEVTVSGALECCGTLFEDLGATPDQGCGCQTPAPFTGGGLPWVLALLGLSRRRSGAAQTATQVGSVTTASARMARASSGRTPPAPTTRKGLVPAQSIRADAARVLHQAGHAAPAPATPRSGNPCPPPALRHSLCISAGLISDPDELAQLERVVGLTQDCWSPSPSPSAATHRAPGSPASHARPRSTRPQQQTSPSPPSGPSPAPSDSRHGLDRCRDTPRAAPVPRRSASPAALCRPSDRPPALSAAPRSSARAPWRR